jgi:hypothetical protein
MQAGSPLNSPLLPGPEHLTWVLFVFMSFESDFTCGQRALTFDEAFTLASNFIVPGSCPSSNPPIAFKANPQLVIQEANVTTGQTIHVSFNITTPQSTPLFAAFLTGVAPNEVFGNFTRMGKGNGTVTVPKGLTGQTYLVLTTTKVQSFTDVGVVAGPAVFFFNFPPNPN